MADFFRLNRTLIFFFFWLAASAHAGQNNLRNVSWGMSRYEVMASEDLSPRSFDAYYIHYKPEVQGREHDLIYGFLDNTLVDAVYVITTLKASDYLTFKGQLDKKYGKPVRAMDGGSGNYMFVWENASTRVIMNPGRLRECRIEYISKKYKYMKDNERYRAQERIRKELFWAF